MGEEEERLRLEEGERQRLEEEERQRLEKEERQRSDGVETENTGLNGAIEEELENEEEGYDFEEEDDLTEGDVNLMLQSFSSISEADSSVVSAMEEEFQERRRSLAVVMAMRNELEDH